MHVCKSIVDETFDHSELHPNGILALSANVLPFNGLYSPSNVADGTWTLSRPLSWNYFDPYNLQAAGTLTGLR